MRQSPVRPGSEAPAAGGPLLLSFDLEDFNQLVQRNLGVDGWDVRRPAFERQMGALFDLLDELNAKATFFLLGVTVRHYPEIAQEIASRGDEIACHGYDHQRVYEQTPDDFRRDLDSSLELIANLTGKRPIGYRAPAFSINRDTVWALEILAEQGLLYDSSQYDSRKIPQRIRPVPEAPYLLELPSGRTLWEFPITAWKIGRWVLPMGGGSYWRILPAPILRYAIRSALTRGDYPALYFHPYECDPRRLRVELGHSPSARQRIGAAYMSLLSNPGRRRVAARIRAIATHYGLVSHEQALAEIGTDNGPRKRALSERGVLV
jgi:polysaccharide deacetylase family protein (PEP-CTERM system associated)